MYLTFTAWNCWAKSVSAFTTSYSLISSSILLPGIWTSLCKYHSSFSLWEPAADSCALQVRHKLCCKDSNIIGTAQPTEDKISRCLFLPITPRDRIPTAGVTEHGWKKLTINKLDQVRTSLRSFKKNKKKTYIKNLIILKGVKVYHYGEWKENKAHCKQQHGTSR